MRFPLCVGSLLCEHTALSALGRRARLVRFEQTDSSTLSAGRAVSAAVSGV